MHNRVALALCSWLIAVLVMLPAGARTATAASETWEIVYSSGLGFLEEVSALNTTTAWAVGTASLSKEQNQVLYWNGTSWGNDPNPVPNPGENINYLYGVAAIPGTSNEAWAVGYYQNNSPDNLVRAQILKRGQTSWAQHFPPNPGTGANYLTDVAAYSQSLAFAVGHYYNGQTGPYQTLILRWNGSQWQQISTPNPGSQNFLNSVSIVNQNLAFAAGYYVTANNEYRTLILKWNGTAWSLETTPSPGTGTNANVLHGGSASRLIAPGPWATTVR